MPPRPIASLLADLDSGELTSRALVEQYLAAIADPNGEGTRAFLSVDVAAARSAADAIDAQRAAGKSLDPLAGIPISIKDLTDVAGQVTTAGSIVLRDAPPAQADAPIVTRLRAAGAIPLGRTNMTEFAFSGLGINPHFGTPRNPYDRAPAPPGEKNHAGRIPGGSSSGAVISVTDGMAAAAIGSDTGGSIRIPAALCGVTGFKPTQHRVPITGAFPLSPTMDSLGPIAPTVACCALIDAVLAGETPRPLQPRPLNTLHLGALQGYVLDSLDPEIASAYANALSTLSAAGAKIEDLRFEALARIPEANRKGTVPTYEGYEIHKDRIAKHGDQYDPIVRTRLLRALDMSPADYAALLEARREIIAAANSAFQPFDAILLPAVACIAPRIAPLEASLDLYLATNALILRNPSIINFLGGCALSIPCHRPGEAPAGLMVAHLAQHDAEILTIGHAIEAALQQAGCAIVV